MVNFSFLFFYNFYKYRKQLKIYYPFVILIKIKWNFRWLFSILLLIDLDQINWAPIKLIQSIRTNSIHGMPIISDVLSKYGNHVEVHRSVCRLFTHLVAIRMVLRLSVIIKYFNSVIFFTFDLYPY